MLVVLNLRLAFTFRPLDLHLLIVSNKNQIVVSAKGQSAPVLCMTQALRMMISSHQDGNLRCWSISSVILNNIPSPSHLISLQKKLLDKIDISTAVLSISPLHEQL